MRITLRFFIETEDYEEAEKAASKAGELLAELGSSISTRVQPYWKIEEYYEVFMVLKLIVDEEKGVDLGTKQLGGNWKKYSSSEAISNFEEDSDFVIEGTRWAHLQLEN